VSVSTRFDTLALTHYLSPTSNTPQTIEDTYKTSVVIAMFCTYFPICHFYMFPTPTYSWEGSVPVDGFFSYSMNQRGIHITELQNSLG